MGSAQITLTLVKNNHRLKLQLQEVTALGERFFIVLSCVFMMLVSKVADFYCFGKHYLQNTSLLEYFSLKIEAYHNVKNPRQK